MTPEKIVQNAIVKYLQSLKKQGLPIYIERRQAGGYSYRKGNADLYAIINGHHLEIEVKAPGGSLRPMQEKRRDICKSLNIDWVCSDSVDEFKLFFEKTYKHLLSN